jgi:hypothetical protein
MRNVPIDAVPNQSLSFTIGSDRWSIRIKQAVSSMFIDVALNDVDIVLGHRIVIGTPILPYRYQRSYGTLLMLTDNEELADWTKFGSTQQLVFATADELNDA